MKKKRIFFLAAILAVVSVVVFFFITRTRVAVSSKVDRINERGSLPHPDMPMMDVPMLDRDGVDWINGGGSLPHPSGGGGGGIHPEPNQGHSHEGSGSNEGNASSHSNSLKPDGTPFPGYPHVVWNGTGRIRPEDGYNWVTPNDPSASNYSVVPLPLGTPCAGHPNVIWTGDGEHFRPAYDYKWEISTADIYDVLPLTTKEKIIVRVLDTIPALKKDKGIWDWVKNVELELRIESAGNPMIPPMMSPWAGDSKLIFTESFLTETPAERENLIAFESGKLFFTMMKDKTVKDGKTLEKWFRDYAGRYGSTILNMRKAKHQNENLPMVVDIADYPSEFGYIFRAQALQLDKPTDLKVQKEWDEAIREFQTYVYPLLWSEQEK
jgi:hypothetical protein